MAFPLFAALLSAPLAVQLVLATGAVIVVKTAVATALDSNATQIGNASVELGDLKIKISDFGFDGSLNGSAGDPFGYAKGNQSGEVLVELALAGSTCIPTPDVDIIISSDPLIIQTGSQVSCLEPILPLPSINSVVNVSIDPSIGPTLTAFDNGGFAEATSSFGLFAGPSPSSLSALFPPLNFAVRNSSMTFKYADYISGGILQYPLTVSSSQKQYLMFKQTLGGTASVSVPGPLPILGVAVFLKSARRLRVLSKNNKKINA
jgi:hypothetical protein